MISRVRCSLLAISVVSTFCVLYSHNNLIQTSNRNRGYETIPASPFMVTGSPSLKSPLVIVVCSPYGNDTYKLQKQSFRESSLNNSKSSGGTEFENEETLTELRTSWTRQSQQTLTMMKTLLYFSKSPKWRIIIISDSERSFQKVVSLTMAFPESERRRLILEYKHLWFPQNYPELRNHWRPCAWAKQFLAETLPEEDAVIYVDSDLLFLGPAEELWWLLKSMGTEQIIALAPEPFYKMEKKTFPYAGRVGLNTGVMAVNLTKARRLPGGGIGSAILAEGPIEPEPRHDQDALNHFLRNKAYLLMEVTSRWNFLPSSCMKTAPPCPDCYSAGIVVLHGADMSFYRPVDVKFSVLNKLLGYCNDLGIVSNLQKSSLTPKGLMECLLVLIDTVTARVFPSDECLNRLREAAQPLLNVYYQVMYATLFHAAIDVSPEELYGKLSGQLVLTDTIKLPYPCSSYSNINEALTLRLADEAVESVLKKKITANIVSKIN